eukprot:1555055-Pleurochrysis_carterae.AAC.1
MLCCSVSSARLSPRSLLRYAWLPAGCKQPSACSLLRVQAALAVISEGHARACKRLWTANPVGEKIK